MRKSILLIIFALGYQQLFAQDIFKQHGFDKKPLTLSNGHYNEFFMNEKNVQIGTILLNTQTKKVVAFLEEDTTKVIYLPEFSSRWISPDPLAAKYPENSPYAYCVNNPIKFVDINGKDVFILIAKNGAGNNGHMGAVIQDAKGNCFYMTVGNADPNASTSKMVSSGTQGGMSLIPLGTKDIYKAVTLAKQDKNNSPYTDQVKLTTSSKMDGSIFKAAEDLQKSINSGETKYNAITNNCADAVETVVEKGTNVDLPMGINPKPNAKFENLKEDIVKVQKEINKEIQVQKDKDEDKTKK